MIGFESIAIGSEALPVRIAGEIAQLISIGEFSESGHLSAQKLADLFKVSRTPILEALELLSKKGLVERRRNRGFFVQDLPHDERHTAIQQFMESSDNPPAYYQLADDWLKEVIPPLVTEQFVRERYGLSKVQVSDVLRRGVEVGWIDRKPGYGWRLLDVAKTPEALEQIYRFRQIVEPAGLLEPTFQIDRPTMKRLAALLEAMSRGAIEIWPFDRLLSVGVMFHEELMRMSGNHLLYQSLCRANSLRRLLEYRSMVDRSRVYRETSEHLEILETVMRGDVVSASFLMRQHLNAAISRKRVAHAGAEL